MKTNKYIWLLVLGSLIPLNGCGKDPEISRGVHTTYQTNQNCYIVVNDQASFRFLYSWISKKESGFPRVDFQKENVALAILPGRVYGTNVSFTEISVNDRGRPVLSLLETRPKKVTWQRYFKRRPWSFARFRHVAGRALVIERYKKKGSRGKVKLKATLQNVSVKSLTDLVSLDLRHRGTKVKSLKTDFARTPVRSHGKLESSVCPLNQCALVSVDISANGKHQISGAVRASFCSEDARYWFKRETTHPRSEWLGPFVPGKYTPRVRDFAVILAGKSKNSQDAGWFWDSSTWLYRNLIGKYGYDHENIYFLHEKASLARSFIAESNPTPNLVVDGKSSLYNIRKVFRHLSGRVQPGDRVFVFFIGHGYSELSSGRKGGEADYVSWFDARGSSDLSGTELNRLLDSLETNYVSAVFSPCRSGGFIPAIAGTDRIVMTSTRASEDNRAAVAEAAIRGLVDDNYDLNGDGRLSFYEAFQSMLLEQEEWYRQYNETQTEHALLEDDGDGVGHHEVNPDNGGDGNLSQEVFLGDDGDPLDLPESAWDRLDRYNQRLSLSGSVHSER